MYRNVSKLSVIAMGLCIGLIGHPGWSDLVLSPGTAVVLPDGTRLDDAGDLGGGGSAPPDHGGVSNTVSGSYAFVGGGFANTASAPYSTIGAGSGNEASGTNSTISGGLSNSAIGSVSTVGGGYGNTASGIHSTVGGGRNNSASEYRSTIGGGDDNASGGYYSTVGGGQSNTANGLRSTIGGGQSNVASGVNSAIGGGKSNTASGVNSAIGGGYNNTASGSYYSTVGGGFDNSASGFGATIPGGRSNSASGDYSFAVGRRASAIHNGAFVLADSADATISSTDTNQLSGRFQNGVVFYTNSALSTGVAVVGGGTSWLSVSAKEVKENYSDIDKSELLEKLANLPIQRWNYIANGDNVQHIGPYAKDFHEAFGLSGEYNGMIATQDLDGVALAAIQGLNQKLEERDAVIEELMTRIARLEAERLNE